MSDNTWYPGCATGRLLSAPLFGGQNQIAKRHQLIPLSTYLQKLGMENLDRLKYALNDISTIHCKRSLNIVIMGDLNAADTDWEQINVQGNSSSNPTLIKQIEVHVVTSMSDHSVLLTMLEVNLTPLMKSPHRIYITLQACRTGQAKRTPYSSRRHSSVKTLKLDPFRKVRHCRRRHSPEASWHRSPLKWSSPIAAFCGYIKAIIRRKDHAYSMYRKARGSKMDHDCNSYKQIQNATQKTLAKSCDNYIKIDIWVY